MNRCSGFRARAGLSLRGAVAGSVGALFLFSAGSTFAQGWPTKPMRIVVSFPPGGGIDVLARQFAPELSRSLGQPVVVENRPGAAGNIGGELVARAAPDGYTVLLGNVGPLAINPALYPKMPFDTLRDFAPVAQIAFAPLLVVVHPSLPARSLKELIALARKRPGEIAFASGGTGAITHLAGELLKQQQGIDMIHVPYKGSAPAFADLLGGQVQLIMDSVPVGAPFVQAKKLRALAVTGRSRSAAMSDLPTAIEAGFPDFTLVGWQGFVMPAATPKLVIDRMNAEVVRLLNDPRFRERLVQQGSEPAPGTPEQFGQLIRDELARWAVVVKRSGAKAE